MELHNDQFLYELLLGSEPADIELLRCISAAIGAETIGRVEAMGMLLGNWSYDEQINLLLILTNKLLTNYLEVLKHGVGKSKKTTEDNVFVARENYATTIRHLMFEGINYGLLDNKIDDCEMIKAKREYFGKSIDLSRYNAEYPNNEEFLFETNEPTSDFSLDNSEKDSLVDSVYTPKRNSPIMVSIPKPQPFVVQKKITTEEYREMAAHYNEAKEKVSNQLENNMLKHIPDIKESIKQDQQENPDQHFLVNSSIREKKRTEYNSEIESEDEAESINSWEEARKQYQEQWTSDDENIDEKMDSLNIQEIDSDEETIEWPQLPDILDKPKGNPLTDNRFCYNKSPTNDSNAYQKEIDSINEEKSIHVKDLMSVFDPKPVPRKRVEVPDFIKKNIENASKPKFGKHQKK